MIVTYSGCVFAAHAPYYVVFGCTIFFLHYLITGTIYEGGGVSEFKFSFDFLYNFVICIVLRRI